MEEGAGRNVDEVTERSGLGQTVTAGGHREAEFPVL